MLSPEDLEYANYYQLPEDTLNDVSTPQSLLTLTDRISISDIMSNYPFTQNMHLIALAAATNNDILSISFLLLYDRYLPIRWSHIYDNTQDYQIKLLIERYYPYLYRYKKNDIDVVIDDRTYLVVLDSALFEGRIDIVDFVMESFDRKEELISPYKDAPLPPISRKYLILGSYIDTDDKERKIVFDDPSEISSLSSSDMDLVLKYDSIHIFKKLMKDVSDFTYVHGRILSYIISNIRDIPITPLILERCSYGDLSVLYDKSSNKRDLYIEIGRRGYFELLYGMSRRDLLIFITSRQYEIMDEGVKTFIRNMYNYTYDSKDMIEGSIINMNIPLFSLLLTSTDMSIDSISSLIEQYYMWDNNIMQRLREVLM
jgi:hypothetical protein